MYGGRGINSPCAALLDSLGVKIVSLTVILEVAEVVSYRGSSIATEILQIFEIFGIRTTLGISLLTTAIITILRSGLLA